MTGQRAVAPFVALAAAAFFTGCGTSGLGFRRDERVSFVTPAERARLRLPIELRWAAATPAPGQGGPYFAVFVDREPMRPGHTLSTVLEASCRRDPSCPDLGYLQERGIYLRDTPDLRLDTIPARRTGARIGAKEGHEAILVLVDRDGRRLGEAAWTRTFTVERSG